MKIDVNNKFGIGEIVYYVMFHELRKGVITEVCVYISNEGNRVSYTLKRISYNDKPETYDYAPEYKVGRKITDIDEKLFF